MTQYAMSDGNDAMLRLATALGLDEVPLRRMVIDIQVDQAIAVYTDQLVEEANFDEFVNIMTKLKPKRVKTNVHGGS